MDTWSEEVPIRLPQLSELGCTCRHEAFALTLGQQTGCTSWAWAA
jgi:hypothetical protein